jgi:hypothetical protein
MSLISGSRRERSGIALFCPCDERRRTMLLTIEDRALAYLRLRLGAAAADRALRIYRDHHRSSMMARASESFFLVILRRMLTKIVRIDRVERTGLPFRDFVEPASVTRTFEHIGHWKRCASLSPDSADRSHHLKSDPWRTLSSLRPSLSVRYTQVSAMDACLPWRTQHSKTFPNALFECRF